jgi:tungstate transport system permease protein
MESTAVVASIWQLLTAAESPLWAIVRLSVWVSCTAVLLAAILALPLAAWLATHRFRGRSTVIALLNALMGFPPVVLGLLVYLLLSRSGPLGSWGILFTPSAMIVAQVCLVTPIITALAWQTLSDEYSRLQPLFDSLVASPRQRLLTLLWECRASLFTAVLAGLGRAFAEVGAVMMVGGNIDGVTRVMTTAIALETSKGELALAIALGMILLTVVLALNLAAQVLKLRWR